MEVTFALIAITVVLVLIIAVILLWAVRAGQFEDLEGPAWRVIMDDDRPIVPVDDDASTPRREVQGKAEPTDGSGHDERG